MNFFTAQHFQFWLHTNTETSKLSLIIFIIASTHELAHIIVIISCHKHGLNQRLTTHIPNPLWRQMTNFEINLLFKNQVPRTRSRLWNRKRNQKVNSWTLTKIKLKEFMGEGIKRRKRRKGKFLKPQVKPRKP